MSRKTLSPASVFERVLRAHETGGVTFKDVRAQLKELLAAGASPADLLETLRRQEQWEPLPESARVEVVGLIDEAIRAAPKNDDSVDASPTAGNTTQPAASGETAGASSDQAEESAGDLTPEARVRRPAPSENVRSLEARIAGQQADYMSLTKSYERAREAESAAKSSVSALAAQVAALEASRDSDHAQAQQNAATLAETVAANDALHARAESAIRDASDARGEIRRLGEWVQVRDAALAEAQRSGSERKVEHDAALQSLEQTRAELRDMREVLSARDTSLETLQSDLQTARSILAEAQRSVGVREAGFDSEFQALRAALVAEQAKSQQAAQLAERSHTDIRSLRDSLSARDESLAEAQRSLGTRAAGLEALQADLQAGRSALADAQRSASEREAGRDSELQALRAALVAEQARNQHAAQVAEQSQEDILGLRDSLSARDESLAEAQRSLGTRAAGLEALQADLQAARSALADAQRSVGEHETGRDSELQALRAALVAEQARNQHAAQAVEQSHADIRSLRDSLSARDESLDEAQRSLGTRPAGLEALQADLQAARSALADAQRSVGEHETGRDSELQALRVALAAEQAKSQDAVRSADQYQEDIRGLRDSLSARDVSLAEAQRSRGTERLPDIRAAHVARPNRAAVIAAIGVILLCVIAAYFMNHRAPPPAPVAVRIAPALPKPGTVIRDCLTCPEITVLPVGKFSQGSAGPGVGPAAFEKPLHEVTISGAIGMATNLVTVDEFQQFVAATGWQSQGCTTYDGEWKARPKGNWSNPGFTQTGKHPVTCASWNDAQAYAKWLSAKAGHTYRLPSASEWEYAARAGSQAAAPWTTESAACANANVADMSAVKRYPGWAAFNCDDGYVYTSPVGSFKANAFGLNDMLGNVFQWTEDCWHPDYVGAPNDGAARIDGPCDEHELRGGSWFTTPAYVSVNYRNHFTADYRSSTVGIRLVRDFGA